MCTLTYLAMTQKVINLSKTMTKSQTPRPRTIKRTRRRAARISRYDLPAHNGEFVYGIGQTVARCLVYALMDPNTSDVRYIGRSHTGLFRPREHVTRVHRERTHKANWIRSLLAAGQMYGVRVLEEFGDDLVAVIDGEIRWIEHGRQAGWPLTNLTDGGEGAAQRKLSLPDDEIVKRYLGGESELSLARAYNVNRRTITIRLQAAGVDRRNGSDAMYLRHARMSPAERLALATPAHVARRKQKL